MRCSEAKSLLLQGEPLGGSTLLTIMILLTEALFIVHSFQRFNLFCRVLLYSLPWVYAHVGSRV